MMDEMLENMLGAEVGIFVPPVETVMTRTLCGARGSGSDVYSSESGDEVVVSKLVI